ncbi:MAG: hypothetical protein L6R38_005641 [Xanthoria sp. 2 TBL-2021]|nr:MAG: hypothetical protein L6R38_005641 [Xanthoria sp. 2 TBL-2021]
MLENVEASPESPHARERVLAVEESHQTPSSEPTWIAIAAGGKHTFTECILHAAPIGMTIWMLVSNGCSVYWKDAGYEYQNPILQALQYLAKLHELLMGASLAQVTLHRIHRGLCTSDGLPLGLVTAAYQLSSITYLITPEFRKSRRLPPGIKSILSRVSLLGLIVVVFLLTLVTGPSSAVAMIPRLDWWDHTNAYPEGSERAFMRYRASDLWPTSITKESIPPSCADTESADAEYCPYSGYEVVSEWVGAHQNQGQVPNLTVPSHGGVTRHLASKYDDKSAGWTITSTVGYKEAWDLGAFWQYAVGQSRSLAQPERPRIAPGFVDRTQIRKPEVRVQCAAYYSWSSRDLELPSQHLVEHVVGSNNQLSNTDPWLIQSSILRSQPRFHDLFPDAGDKDQKHLHQFPTAFTWVDTSGISNGPSIGAVFAVNTPNQSVALVPCSIVAYWTPTSIFLDPKSEMVIQEETPDPLKQSLSGLRMTIASDWADAMNPNFTDDNGLETTYIQHMMERYNNNSSSPVIFSEPGYGQESIPWRIATALGLYLTEALARVQSTFWNGTVLCHTNVTNQENVYILANLNANDPQWWPENKTFTDYAHEQGWAELEFAVQRYGYGWGFRGVPIKLAAAVLVLQASLGLTHMGIIVFGGWNAMSWSTMGEMLVLAINSSPSKRLGGTAAGIEDHLWGEPAKIRETRDRHLELVLDGGLPPEREVGLRPRKGRGYR